MISGATFLGENLVLKFLLSQLNVTEEELEDHSRIKDTPYLVSLMKVRMNASKTWVVYRDLGGWQCARLATTHTHTHTHTHTPSRFLASTLGKTLTCWSVWVVIAVCNQTLLLLLMVLRSGNDAYTYSSASKIGFISLNWNSYWSLSNWPIPLW